MSTISTIDIRDVTATLNYLVPSGERPAIHTVQPPEGAPWRTGASLPQVVTIRDARPLLSQLSLDRQGFTLIRHKADVENFYDPREVRASYYPKAAAAIRRASGAAQVFVFDHNVRNASKALRNEDGAREPARSVHNDFTAASGRRRAEDELAAAGLDPRPLLRRRFAIINLWQPIRGPVRDAPLALCDAGSVAPEDLIASDLIRRDRVGEIYQLAYNPAHRWFYFPDMRADEALLIKCFDSDGDVARFAPHSAFDDPSVSPGAPPRESIELRSLAIFAPRTA
ncbi:MAG TPA: CmcJ/NvfI family oxidoreductase [Stellaceae bacterium]|nr:CmcJ/NvfI family oxidoreductase [Stellaceae bacterium]